MGGGGKIKREEDHSLETRDDDISRSMGKGFLFFSLITVGPIHYVITGYASPLVGWIPWTSTPSSMRIC